MQELTISSKQTTQLMICNPNSLSAFVDLPMYLPLLPHYSHTTSTGHAKSFPSFIKSKLQSKLKPY